MRLIEQRLFLVAVCVLLAACESAPRAPQTVEESIYIAAVYGEGLAVTVNDAYITGVISKEQQMELLDNLQYALDGLRVALEVYQSGDLKQAEDRLAVAEGILRAAALLVSKVGD